MRHFQRPRRGPYNYSPPLVVECSFCAKRFAINSPRDKKRIALDVASNTWRSPCCGATAAVPELGPGVDQGKTHPSILQQDSNLQRRFLDIYTLRSPRPTESK
jgi:hypothetical protein